MSSPAAVPALVAALEDRTADVRTAAARSLGRLAAPEAVRPLLGAMSDRRVPEAMVRWALLQGGPEVLPSLRALVNRADPAERAGAVQLLGLLGDAADEPALIARLGDSSAKVRERAARALGRIGSGGAVAGLRRALADRIPAVRAAAAESLGRLGDPSGLEALIMQAGTDSFEPARAAAYAAAQLDPERVAATARVTRAPHLLEAADVVALR